MPCRAVQSGPGEFLQTGTGDKPALGVTLSPLCSKQGTEHTGTHAARWTLQGCIEPPKGNGDGDNSAKKHPRPCPAAGRVREQAAFWLLPDGVGFGGVPREQALRQVLVPTSLLVSLGST